MNDRDGQHTKHVEEIRGCYEKRLRLDPIIRNGDINKRLVMISANVGPTKANASGTITFAVSNIGAMTAAESTV